MVRIILMIFVSLQACRPSTDDECAVWDLFEWDDFFLNPCLRGETMSTGMTRRSDPACEPPELEGRGVRGHPDPEPTVERGGGLPEALGVPHRGDDPFPWAFPVGSRKKKRSSLDEDLLWMDLRIERVKAPLEGAPNKELERFLWGHRRRFEHLYEQKYPWAVPPGLRVAADRPGPEGRIYFYLHFNTDLRVTRCGFMEPEALRGLGDRICSTLKTWRFPHAPQGAEGPATGAFALDFRLRAFECVDDGAGFMIIKIKRTSPDPVSLR